MLAKEFLYKEHKDRFYPIIPVHLRNKDLELDLDVLIDSGASISVFKGEIADILGIKVEEGQKMQSVGVSGQISVFLHTVEFRIFDKWFPCKVAFSRQLTTSFNLLGREDFFIRHLITFNEKERRLSKKLNN